MDWSTLHAPVNLSGHLASQLQQEAKDSIPSIDTTDLSTSSPTFTLLPLSVLLTLTPLMLCIIAVSVGGNVMVLLSYRPHLLFVDAQSLYLLQLAVSDLLISVVCMPLHLVSTVWSSGWPLGRVMCHVYTAVQLTLLNVTTLVLVLVALDGLLQAEDGIRSTGLEAKKKAYVLLALCWLLAVAVHLPETLSWGIAQGHSFVSDNVCRPGFYKSVGHVLFVQVWSFFLPVFILSVINTRLYFRLRRLSQTILTFGHTFPGRPGSKYDIVGGQKENLETHGRIAVSDTNVVTEDFQDLCRITLRPHSDCLGQKQAVKPVSKMVYTVRSPLKSLSTSYGKMLRRSLSVGQIGKIVSHTGKRFYRNRDEGRRSQSSDNIEAVKFQEIDTNTTAEGVLVTSGSDTNPPGDGGDSSPAQAGCLASRSRHVSLERPYRLKRVAVILFTLVLILVVCWLPYSVAFLVRSICQDCVHPIVYGVLVWVLYFKSCINPFLYAYNTFAFRNRFRRLLVRIFPVKRFRRMTTDRVSNERTSILN